MTYRVKISAKNQITLPVSFLKEEGLHKGDYLILSKSKKGKINLSSEEEAYNNISKIVAKYNLPKISVEKAIEISRKNDKNKFNYEK